MVLLTLCQCERHAHSRYLQLCHVGVPHPGEIPIPRWPSGAICWRGAVVSQTSITRGSLSLRLCHGRRCDVSVASHEHHTLDSLHPLGTRWSVHVWGSRSEPNCPPDRIFLLKAAGLTAALVGNSGPFPASLRPRPTPRHSDQATRASQVTESCLPYHCCCGD